MKMNLSTLKMCTMNLFHSCFTLLFIMYTKLESTIRSLQTTSAVYILVECGYEKYGNKKLPGKKLN